MEKQALLNAADALSGVNPAKIPAMLGFDGFVDTILHVVDTRVSADEFIRMENMADYGKRISDSAGYSCNIEVVTIQEKLGGNGTILSNALIGYGMPLTYIGSVGLPAVHQVFADMAKRCKVISIAEVAKTDAIEFFDGKIMVGNHASLRDVNWGNIIKYVGTEGFKALLENCILIGFENWTMLPHMSDIWRHIQSEILPSLKPDRSKTLFFDLADPGKRQKSDIAEAMELIGGFKSHFKVVLGLNEKETAEVAGALGTPVDSDLEKRMRGIFERLNLDCLVVHPTKEAMALTETEFVRVSGPYCAKPKLTTGAGDNFNGGFLLGLSGGLDLEKSLLLGVAASGYYVRNAHSPDKAQLEGFLSDWANGALE